MPRIRVETTPTASLAYCECGWRELCLTRDGARRVATRHEHDVHPEQMQVRAAARQRNNRFRMSRLEVDNAEHDADDET